MDGGFQYFDLVLLGLIVAFILLRLRSVLGRRTGQEGPPRPFPGAKGQDHPGPAGRDDVKRDDSNVIPLPRPDREPALPPIDEEPASPLDQTLAAVRRTDPAFDPRQFAEGARMAYEMIITAFASGDRETLSGLLSRELFGQFDQAIRQREQAGQTLERTLVGISKAEIVEARFDGKTAELTVRFVSEQIDALKDSSGAVIEDDGVNEVTDDWTFARNVKSRDPNWTLIATLSPS